MSLPPDIQNTADMVKEFGYAIIHVRSVQGDPHSRILFSFTVGMPEYCKAPEIVISGLDQDPTILMTNGIVACRNAGWEWTGEAVQLEGIMKAHPIELRPVHPDNFSHLLAHNMQVREALTMQPLKDVAQAFFPDRKGRFPWHEDLMPEFKYQPRFDIPIASAPAQA